MPKTSAPDPESFAEKIRSIATPRRFGSSERRPVISDETGKPAGHHVEHWDGRRDAVATPETVRLNTGVNR